MNGFEGQEEKKLLDKESDDENVTELPAAKDEESKNGKKNPEDLPGLAGRQASIVSQTTETSEESEIEDPATDPMLKKGLEQSKTEEPEEEYEYSQEDIDYYASQAYDSAAYAAKLEPIAEHEVLEFGETPETLDAVGIQSPSGEKHVPESSIPHLSLDFDSAVTGADIGISGTADRSISPSGGHEGGLLYYSHSEVGSNEHGVYEVGPPPSGVPSFARQHSNTAFEASHAHGIPRNHTEPSGLGLVFRHVHSFVGRRFFGSTGVTPSDSLQSLDFGATGAVLNQQPVGMGGSSSNRMLRHSYSSRNSVSSEGGRRNASRRKREERRIMMAGPSGQVVSRSKRFLTKGTAGFLGARGTSAINLRPSDVSQGLPSPCGECPHCRKFLKLGEPGIPLRALGHACPCRICNILEDNAPGAPSRLGSKGVTRGKTPGGLGITRNISNAGDYGAFCDACSAQGVNEGPPGSVLKSCSRYSMAGLGGGSLASHGHGLPMQPHVVVGTGARNSLISGSATPSTESLLVGRQIPGRDIPCMPSRQVSTSSISNGLAMCRICHSTDSKEEALLSPCRCMGTLKYVHMSCLVHWLEISCRKLRKPSQCELCGYRYQRHKVLNLRNCMWPKCSRRDKILHSVFVLSLLMMLVCAAVTIVCFKADSSGSRGRIDNVQPVELTPKEVVTLVCGVMFFVCFFVAMYVQVKAHATLYKLIVRFWMINHEWFVEEYRPQSDPEWIKKTKMIREELAASVAARGKTAASAEPQRFLTVPGPSGDPEMPVNFSPGISGSTSRRSSISSTDMNLENLLIEESAKQSSGDCEREEANVPLGLGRVEKEKVGFMVGDDDSDFIAKKASV